MVVRKLLALIFLLGVCLLYAPSNTDAAQQQVRENQVWYRMHFGTGVGEKAVSCDLIRSFIDANITPQFPKGLTIIDARGQWSVEGTGLIRERTIVVELYCDDTEENGEQVETIARAYVDRFSKAKASCFVTRVRNLDAAQYY